MIQVPFMDAPTSGFFAIYDGHGGKEAADIVSSELHHFLKEELSSGTNSSVQESFVKAYEKTDERLKFDALYMGATGGPQPTIHAQARPPRRSPCLRCCSN